MLGVKEKERARGRKGEGLWRGRAGGRAVEALRAWAARRMLRQALEKAQRGGEEELQAGSALPWRVMQLLKKCEGWKVIVEEEKGYRALLVRGEEHFESRGEERGILAWVAYVVALKMQRAALKRVERSMDPRCHRQQEQQEEQQQEEQQLSALSPRLPSASFLPSLPPPTSSTPPTPASLTEGSISHWTDGSFIPTSRGASPPPSCVPAVITYSRNGRACDGRYSNKSGEKRQHVWLLKRWWLPTRGEGDLEYG